MKKKLQRSEMAILETVYLLSKEGYEATSKGVNDLLRGKIDDPRFHPLSQLEVFAYYHGASRKTLGPKIKGLIEKGYLRSYRDPFKKEAYLALTPLGESLVPCPLPEKAPHLYAPEIRKKGEKE